MRPSMAQILMGSAGAIGTQVAPHLTGNGYALGQASMAGLIMVLAAQEADRAADVLVRERNALRVFFGEASVSLLPEDLRARLHEAAHAPLGASFVVSALEEEIAPMKALLIETHAALEDETASWARDLEARVWAVLKEGADARQLFMPSL
ncbi:MAG: hypothetical protein GC189_03160 [Alphaproteobacteria bacterium]|nr:hypothetical protein [Alphaproteobacteria bacterium]